MKDCGAFLAQFPANAGNMLVTVLCCLVVLGLATPGAQAAFGDSMDHGRDDLFERMGKARVDTFEIVEGEVVLNIILEDTVDQDEVWILDFQPFQFNNVTHRAVIQDNGGSLVANNTGTCSNVVSTVLYHPDTGFYKDTFEPSIPGGKNLFNYYERGNEIIQQGDIKIREDLMAFIGPIDTLFNCKNSDQLTVWEKKVTPDTIQFNATLYMTNVRPQGTGASPEPAYVQSYAILYWRLLRVALSRFLLSSTERVRPIFVYAIVTPVYLNDDEVYGLDRSRAQVEILFRTTTNHPDGNLISVYKVNTLVYEPADAVLSSISHIKTIPNFGCDRPLGVENGDIADSGITASSYWLEGSSLEYSPDKGRLNAQPLETVTSGSWLAGTTNPGEWIQVDFLEQKWVSAVRTQGIGDNVISMWVKEYTVMYSATSEVNLSPLLNASGATHVFSANYDGQTIVTNYFDEAIVARIIRILPTDWDNSIALRFELLGCEDHLECYINPLGTDYRGMAHVTETGKTCQRWSVQDPIIHQYDPQSYADSGIGDHNFCRNPSSDSRPWCYTLDPSMPLDYCNVGVPSGSCIEADVTNNAPDMYTTYYAPSCNFTEWENMCTQSWSFVVVLVVDTTGAVNRIPIDATGEFTFEFETYNCPNNDRSACTKIDVPNAIISNEITLQTTVEIVDDVKDSPRVYLKKVHGKDSTIDIRNGYRPGVSHLETVTVDMHFFPQFLRTRLELELTLFMVCIGREYRDTAHGCIDAPPEMSYTAYVSPYFFYHKLNDDQTFVDLYSDDIVKSTQSLESHGYIHAEEIHRSNFVNKALSALSREYTITNVFRLVEQTERRKRNIQRRDVKDNIDKPIAVHQTIHFTGCPPNSTHDAKNYACVCRNKGEEYSRGSFKCEKSTTRNFNEEENLEDNIDNSDAVDSSNNLDGSGSSAVVSATPISQLLGILIALALAF